MKKYVLIAPCHFGLEAVLKREILDLGYEILRTEDGRVLFEGDEEAVARANIGLRTAERILIRVGEFTARTYDELFEGTKACPWAEFLPEDARFWVKKASTVKSALFSPSDIQRIMKKAIVDRMGQHYGRTRFDETGRDYPLRVFLYKDLVTIGLDTTGDSLHKRGYRKKQGAAPISENLAAAIILLSPWKADRPFVDPFCGSGTFPLEAALMAARIAPGLHRHFTAEGWDGLVPERFWKDAFQEAREEVDLNVETDIQGYDIDPEVLKAARENAERAGVSRLIHFQERAVKDLRHPKEYGFLFANPPYGERMEEKDMLDGIYRDLGTAMARLETWSSFVITSYENAEKAIGKKAEKNRKIYNGMLKTYLYQFPGPKPPRRRKPGT